MNVPKWSVQNSTLGIDNLIKFILAVFEGMSLRQLISLRLRR